MGLHGVIPIPKPGIQSGSILCAFRRLLNVRQKFGEIFVARVCLPSYPAGISPQFVVFAYCVEATDMKFDLINVHDYSEVEVGDCIS